MAEQQLTKIDRKMTRMQDTIDTLQVIDQRSYDQAGAILLGLKTAITEVEDALDPQCKSAYSNWQIALAQKKKYLTPYQEMEAKVKQAMGDYFLIQEQKRIEDQRRVEAEATALEEKERVKILKKAEKAEEKGNLDKADQLRMDAEMVHIPQVQVSPTIQKMVGVATRIDHNIEVVDPMALIKAIAKGEVKINVDKLITFKSTILKQYYDATGEVPSGCRATPKTIMSASKGGKK
jgi:hypothetical protein